MTTTSTGARNLTRSRRSFVQRLAAAVAVFTAAPVAAASAAPINAFGMSDAFCRSFAKLDAYAQAVIVESTWLFTLANTPAPCPPRPTDLFTPRQQ